MYERKSKIIAFDIDDTITNETEFMIRMAPKFLKDHGFSSEDINFEGYNLDEYYKLDNQLLNKGYSAEGAKFLSKKLVNRFWRKHFLKYSLQRIDKEIINGINSLKKEGNKILFLSMRGRITTSKESSFDRFIRLIIVPALTRLQLLRSKMKYDDVILFESFESKLDYLHKNAVDYYVDDQYDMIKCLKSNVKPILRMRSHNQHINVSNNVTKLHELNEKSLRKAFHVRKKKPYNQIKNFTVYKTLTELFYQLLRVPFTVFVISKRPIYHNLENIPRTKSPLLIISNHRETLDPLIISRVIRRPIHWMAALKMFLKHENIFSKHNHYKGIGSMLIKGAGAIPIARIKRLNLYSGLIDSLKELAIFNKESLNQVEDFLDRSGTIGVFPEGTINQNHRSVNLLPLASDRIFKIGKEKHAIILPVSIIWYTDQINGLKRPVVKIGKPITTNQKEYDEITMEWEVCVNNGIDWLNDKYCTGQCVDF